MNLLDKATTFATLSHTAMKTLGRRRQVRYQLAEEHGQFLATRSRGAQVQEALMAALRDTPEGDHLVIDFVGVEDVTVSFVDESLGGLLGKRSNDETLSARGIALTELNPDCRDTLDAVLKRRESAMVVVRPDTDELEIVGDRRWGWMPDTLAAARRLKEFRANDLADELALTPQASNNRLRQLVASGAVARQRVVPEGGGKEFQYRIQILDV
ncbi:MAG: STAS-like domain-containing protein [Actinobacteria bacterium]|nr:STAS-like domain-containing protein [Actinomycetota bacterium]